MLKLLCLADMVPRRQKTVLGWKTLQKLYRNPKAFTFRLLATIWLGKCLCASRRSTRRRKGGTFEVKNQPLISKIAFSF